MKTKTNNHEDLYFIDHAKHNNRAINKSFIRKEERLPFPTDSRYESLLLLGLCSQPDPVLIPHLRKAFQLTDLESSLVDFSIFIAYFLMAIPAGNVMRKYGYKSGIILGLCLFAIGAFLLFPQPIPRCTFSF